MVRLSSRQPDASKLLRDKNLRPVFQALDSLERHSCRINSIREVDANSGLSPNGIPNGQLIPLA